MCIKAVDFHCRSHLQFKIVWKRSSKSSNFSFLPWNIIVFVDGGFSIADVVGRCWDAVTAITSVNLLFWVLCSLIARLWLFYNKGNVVSRDSCLIKCCGCVGSRWVRICPKKNSWTSCWAFSDVTMWWVCVCRSTFLLLTNKSPPLR